MSLRSALLGVLSIRAMTGYEIKRHFDRAVNFVWDASDSQIYRELRKLEHGGLLTAETIAQSSRPDKRVYHLAEPGASELDKWLVSDVAPPFEKDPFLLRLFFFGRLKPSEAVQVLLDRRAQLKALVAVGDDRLKEYSGVALEDHNGRLWWQVRLIDGMRELSLAQIAWLDHVVEQVREAAEMQIKGERNEDE